MANILKMLQKAILPAASISTAIIAHHNIQEERQILDPTLKQTVQHNDTYNSSVVNALDVTDAGMSWLNGALLAFPEMWKEGTKCLKKT